MTKAEFVRRYNRDPIDDEMERINCSLVGEVGH